MDFQDKVKIFAGGAALCLGAGAGLWGLSVLAERKAAETQPQAGEPIRYQEPRTVRLPAPERPDQPLLTDAPPRQSASLQVLRGEPDPYEKALEVLRSKAGDPVGRRFADDFMSAPPLRAGWERFARERDPAPLLALLKASPDFSRLIARYADEPAFKPLSEEVAHRLELDAWIRSGPTSGSAGRSR